MVTSYVGSNAAAGTGVQALFERDLSCEAQLRRFHIVNEGGETQRLLVCDEPVCFELEMEVHHPVRGLYGYLCVKTTDETVVLESDSHNSPPNSLDDLGLGMHRFQLAIPRRTLGVGEYTVYLNFTSRTASNWNVHSPGIVGQFSVQDHSTQTGNNRRGYLSTVVSWGKLDGSGSASINPTKDPQHAQ